MFLLIFITVTAIHLAYPYGASDKFSCTEPHKDAESFLKLTAATTLCNEMKMNFITRFSAGRNKFPRNCWPDDVNCISNSQQNPERTTQK